VVVNRDDKRGRASSFGEVADAYERARPGYPDKAVRWLTGESPCDVVDLGAGTGKLTRSLIALGNSVTAVEPLGEMRAQLEAAVPGVQALSGTAERIPLPDGAADVVTCAQSFHWFDHPAALREIARVLRPGGRLALVWNMRDDREPWVAKLSEAVLGNETIDEFDVQEPIAASGLFGPVEHETFSYVQPLGRTRLLELVLSRSYCAVRSDEERAPMLEQVGRIFDEHAVAGAVDLPYVTECFRAGVGA
jgi:ubiquinone/menaquinone biosynthesis C-methylase UbiE